MAKALTATISNQRSSQAIRITTVFKIGGITFTDYLLPNWSISYDTKFGAAKASFALNNNDGRFGEEGVNKLNVGDIIELSVYFTGDSTEFKKFYGVIKSRSLTKLGMQRIITISCLDYISIIQTLDIDLTVEGTRVEVLEEPLTPIYLPEPNQDLAQLFNFANNKIATNPPPFIKFKDLNHTNHEDAQYDGYEVYYDVGQIKLGKALNVRYNFEVLGTYFYYPKGKYVEDAIEEILTQVDGYGTYLFGETSAAAVIANHFTETYSVVEGVSTNTMTSNTTTETINIETQLTSNINEGTAWIAVNSTEGFPDFGTGDINGDTFTWEAKTPTTLTGIPGSGTYSLQAHNEDDYANYETTYAIGQVWYLSYNNLTSTLVSGNFTVPGETISYVDHKFGRIILDGAISTAATVTCNIDYIFKTLQSTGIAINQMKFRSREIKNRFEAINKLRKYLAPNYILRTIGDNKIWASYLTQKSNADYTLDLEKNIMYMEDTDIYTRVIAWATNENPTNIMFGDDIDYTSETEDDYTGVASRVELAYFGEEKSGILSSWASAVLTEAQLLHMSDTERLITYVRDTYIKKDYGTQETTGMRVYGTTISGAGGLILGDVEPTVWINDVPINNTIAQQTSLPVKVKSSIKTITEGGGKSKSVSTTTYYYYSVMLAHSSIVPSEPIYVYDNQGILQYTVSPGDGNMNYATGIYTVPGSEQNETVETLSTATYKVLYATSAISINYKDAIFRIDSAIIPDPDETVIRGTFEYWAIAIAIRDIAHIVDGKRDTQLQLEFFGEPPANFHLATIDLGEEFNIQAIDIVGGFFRPDEYRKFDVGFAMSMRYSTDNINFYAITDETENFQVGGGEAVTFEEEELGSSFIARYLKFTLDNVDNIPYGKGRYVVAITEISCYDDIVINSSATLIPTTQLTSAVVDSDNMIYVNSTERFAQPESGSSIAAYIDGTYSFFYDFITPNAFHGCNIVGGGSGSIGDRITQTVESDRTLYDDDGLLPQLGDRMYKKDLISERNLFNQEELDNVSRAFLREFYKNHTKARVSVVYAPYLQVGQTVRLTDAYNSINQNYFIENISLSGTQADLLLARYPST